MTILKSDGLGGFSGVSNTLGLGATKNVTCKKFHLFFMFYFLTYMYSNDNHISSCFSIILSFQRSNEVYRYIKSPCRLVKHVPNKNVIFSRNMISTLLILVITTWLSFLLLRSGDVELNPGPGSVEGSSDSSLNSSDNASQMLFNHLSILHLNIQSILPKFDLVQCEADAYDVLVFSESWLKPEVSNESIKLENFQPPFRKDRCNRPGGGVVMYVRDSFPCKRRTDLEIHGLEAVWVELQVKLRKILIGGFYRPPNSNSEYFDLISESVDRAYNTNIIDIFILGDFNFNMSTDSNNKMKDLLQQYNLKQLISDSTHFTENSSSLIDLILVRNNNNVLVSGVVDPFIPDQTRYHCPIIVLLKFLRPSIKSYKRRIWSYKSADFGKYRALLQSLNLDGQLQTNDNIEENVRFVTEAIFSAAEQSISNKIVTIRPSEHPWITCQIKNLIRKRKRAYMKYKRTSDVRCWQKYKGIRNKVVFAIRKSKQAYFDKLDFLLSNELTNTKMFWKTSKQVLKLGKTSSYLPTLVMDNEYAESDVQKATMLNKYFTSQTVVDDGNKPLPSLPPAQYTLISFEISVQDVKDVLKNLDISKACGPDLVSPILLKEGADILASPFSIVFNRSLYSGYFPTLWKDANVTPIPKKDDKSLPSNFRPISLLSHVGKCMERCVHKHLYNYVITNKILTSYQSGFIQGDSTTYQLIHTYHTFCEAIDRGKEVRVIFCDISKAFDRVWHKGLLHKLSSIGCSDRIIKWFSSYLSNRKQRVVINGQSSEWAYIYAGVPQGSILGPLLFLIYINDIVKDIGSSIRLFADDTSLYIVVDSPNAAAFTLNRDLENISKWAQEWLVDFNPNKTCSMIISRKINKILHPPLFMNNIALTETRSHKHLGLTFSDTATWSEHIKNITGKAWTRLNLLRSLKFKVSRKALEHIYVAFIRPLLEYSDSVWDNCSTETKHLLDAIHIEAARIITGGTKLCGIEKMFTDLGWESLQSRRNKHKLIVFYKILNGLAPQYLSDLVPPLVQQNTRYNLRNYDHIQIPHANTNLYYNSFLPSTIRAWNSLDDEIKLSSSVAAFKYRLNRNIKRPPSYFSVGSRIGQILHARLRMECSSLNSDLYRKRIVSTPSCTCGEFESVYHFFFQCPKYATARARYLPANIDDFTTRDFLFGSENKTIHENEVLFLEVQEFLVQSGRFL